MRYICTVCGYVYDDAKESQSFESLPDDWHCPLCGASKSDFKPEAAPSAVSASPVKPAMPVTEDLKKLSVGQLAALCSNLARGCEKQYDEASAGQFRRLADYFTAVVPAVENASVQGLADALTGDIENYSNVRATADAAGDRGAARICVWGEKVTRMLSSLVNRYLNEGEKLLADTEIWLCTTCGFVYIGDTPPEICPVCKVPSWKFEKIEGRRSV